MAQRDLKSLTNEERKKVNIRIREVRKELGFKIGDPITYDLIDKAHKWALSRFRYKSDDYTFNSDDFWNPLAFDWLMLDDYLEDDCDGFGYSILGVLHFILNIDGKRLYRVSCMTETNEGHFVAWVEADDGIIYQVENRVRQPRTLKYMRELGYSYLYFSNMSPQHIKPNKWFDAKKKASEIIYNTPAGLESDRPPVTVNAIVNNMNKSESMQVGGGILGSGIGVSAAIAMIDKLSSGNIDWKIVAIVGAYGLVAALAVWIVRARTHGALFTKVAKNLRADSDGFVG